MDIGIIGAGFSGLAAAQRLAGKGHHITILEKSGSPGGLAGGFRDPRWAWSLDKHYHHFFTSDSAVLRMAADLEQSVLFNRPSTSVLYNGDINRFDDPKSVLQFPHLKLVDKLRVAAVTAALKVSPLLPWYEQITAREFLLKFEGRSAWEVLWEPLFTGKFGRYSSQVSAAWYWTRINKRSPALGYPAGGFQSLADNLAKKLANDGVDLIFNSPVKKISKTGQKFVVLTESGSRYSFDRIIFTLPFFDLKNLYPRFPSGYMERINRNPYLGAVNLVLALKQSFLKKDYWLNINDRRMPFLAVVEHTNMSSPEYYAGDRLVYIGNYLSRDHRYFSLTANELLREFLPHLQKIHPGFDLTWVRRSWVWKNAFAQQVVGRNYARLIPPVSSPVAGFYVANMQQVYPWDRGTNYAVELGQKAANLCLTV